MTDIAPGLWLNRILRFLEWYGGGVGLLVVADGFHLFWFHLENEVTATLVGSTAVAAIGLVGYVVRVSSRLQAAANVSNKRPQRRRARAANPVGVFSR